MQRTSKKQPEEGPAPGADFKPAEVLVIDTPEMLKAAGDPLRLKIIELLHKEALTVKQIATRLGEPPTKLYYHVAELEALGFVTLVGTRVKSGILEKYYRLAAESVTVDPQLLDFSGEGEGGVASMLRAIFDATVDDLVRSLNAGQVVIPTVDTGQDSPFVITRCHFRIREERVSEFVGKFSDLLRQLGEEEQHVADGTTDGQYFACTIAFYPQVEGAQEKEPKQE